MPRSSLLEVLSSFVKISRAGRIFRILQITHLLSNTRDVSFPPPTFFFFLMVEVWGGQKLSILKIS